MSEFASWVGRQTAQTDMVDDEQLTRWFATFDLPRSFDKQVPQGFHFCLCLPEARTDQLGEDGHPIRDEDPDNIYPPFALPRRMWAGSSIQFLRPLNFPDTVERESTITAISEKEGKSGKLAFTEIEHSLWADGKEAIRETQTLVYREAADKRAPLSPPEPTGQAFDPSDWAAHRSLVPDARLLFRYSALTFNTHRIHYDAPYAREVERYRGLVVHGPLIASLLLQLAARELGDNAIASFEFRGVSPAIADEELHLAIRPESAGDHKRYELAAFASDGRQVTKASAIAR